MFDLEKTVTHAVFPLFPCVGWLAYDEDPSGGPTWSTGSDKPFLLKVVRYIDSDARVWGPRDAFGRDAFQEQTF